MKHVTIVLSGFRFGELSQGRHCIRCRANSVYGSELNLIPKFSRVTVQVHNGGVYTSMSIPMFTCTDAQSRGINTCTVSRLNRVMSSLVVAHLHISSLGCKAKATGMDGGISQILPDPTQVLLWFGSIPIPWPWSFFRINTPGKPSF